MDGDWKKNTLTWEKSSVTQHQDRALIISFLRIFCLLAITWTTIINTINISTIRQQHRSTRRVVSSSKSKIDTFSYSISGHPRSRSSLLRTCWDVCLTFNTDILIITSSPCYIMVLFPLYLVSSLSALLNFKLLNDLFIKSQGTTLNSQDHVIISGR